MISDGVASRAAALPLSQVAHVLTLTLYFPSPNAPHKQGYYIIVIQTLMGCTVV
jgi:hypothetical protein